MLASAVAVALSAQQMPDRSFRPMLEDPAYAVGTGPVVCFDEGHNNAHTVADGFWPFGDLVRRDGYVIRAMAATPQPSLADCRILVVVAPRSNVLGAESIRRWVAEGGSLLVIGDRDARAAASDLASAFGVTFLDDPLKPTTFRAADRSLRPHAITRGRHAKESALSVSTSAAGQAMRVPSTAEPVLVASDGAVQGAVMRVEMGRAAFFGDTALFTAQIVGPERRLVGMNARGEQNFQFVLNVMHWLSGVI
jgi:hypothetical protein